MSDEPQHTAQIVWLRRDLRIHDHEPLARALEAGGPVVAVYCFDPREHGQTHLGGFPKTGAHRTRFLLGAVASLRSEFRRRGADLVLRHGRPEDVLPELARALDARIVRAHLEVASEERAVERAVAAALPPGTKLEGSWGHTLIHRDDLPFPIASMPELFTRFREAVEKHSTPRPMWTTPSLLPPLPAGLDAGTLPSLSDLGVDAPVDDPRQRMHFEGGETEGIGRLEQWLFEADALKTYKETRNGLLARDDSSKLSPWLAAGCLSPRRVHAAVKEYERERGANDSTYWMFFELLWRDYFRFIVAKHGDLVFRIGGLVGADIAWREDEAAFACWRRGQTGYPLVDAAMRELLATGYTSNRARQNVASFLTKNLGIDWRLGAAWFESQLVDYDVASNWGNWLYFAGVGNDARGFRFFDLRKQAATYDLHGDFARHWLPELAAIEGGAIYHPDDLGVEERARLGMRYPAPIVDFEASAAACKRTYEEGIARATRKPGSPMR